MLRLESNKYLDSKRPKYTETSTQLTVNDVLLNFYK